MVTSSWQKLCCITHDEVPSKLLMTDCLKNKHRRTDAMQGGGSDEKTTETAPPQTKNQNRG